MGTLVALYKPFDLSLQNLIKYKYLLYISFLFCLVSTVPFYSRKKKETKKQGEKNEKRTRCINFAICFQPAALLSIDVFFFSLFFFCFVSFLFCSFSFFCHFLLVFNLLFVKINKKTPGCLFKKNKNKKKEAYLPKTSISGQIERYQPSYTLMAPYKCF